MRTKRAGAHARPPRLCAKGGKSLKKPKRFGMTRYDELTVAFLKLWRQLDDDTKDRIEAELRRLLKEEHGSWEVGCA
jgi:hypothetical protein